MSFEKTSRDDPNEYNPFEPPESPAQRLARVGAMIKKNVDEQLDRKVFLDIVAISLSDQELAYLLMKIGSDRVLATLNATRLGM